MKPTRLGLTIGLGAGAVASAGYASAVSLARRPLSPVAPDSAIEEALDSWLAEIGVVGRHHYVPSSAGRIHALEVGHGDAPLIFLHGLGASAGEYAALLARLGTHFRVLGIDRPGGGLSDPVQFQGHPRRPWNEAVLAVADELGIKRFDLVGHSLGGLAAGGLAIDHPDRVERLVLLSPVGISSRLPMVWSLSMLPGITDILTAAARLATARQGREQAVAVPAVGPGPVRVGPDLATYRHLVARRFSKGGDLETIPRLMRPFGFRPESLLLPDLDRLASRTLLVWGDHDEQVALAPARDELGKHPKITLRVLEGAGHLFPFEDPLATASLIHAWCGSSARSGHELAGS